MFYTKEELEGDTEMDIIARKALLPFVDARFETVGEKAVPVCRNAFRRRMTGPIIPLFSLHTTWTIRVTG